MEEENIPKVVLKIGVDYFEAKTSPEDLEAMLDGNEKLGKYQLPTVMDRIATTDVKIPQKKLHTYGAQIAIRKTIMAPGGFVDRKTLNEAILDFFDSALSIARVYRSPYVIMEKMRIHEMATGEVIVYEVNGLAQLLRRIS